MAEDEENSFDDILGETDFNDPSYDLELINILKIDYDPID